DVLLNGSHQILGNSKVTPVRIRAGDGVVEHVAVGGEGLGVFEVGVGDGLGEGAPVGGHEAAEAGAVVAGAGVVGPWHASRLPGQCCGGSFSARTITAPSLSLSVFSLITESSLGSTPYQRETRATSTATGVFTSRCCSADWHARKPAMIPSRA